MYEQYETDQAKPTKETVEIKRLDKPIKLIEENQFKVPPISTSTLMQHVEPEQYQQLKSPMKQVTLPKTLQTLLKNLKVD